MLAAAKKKLFAKRAVRTPRAPRSPIAAFFTLPNLSLAFVLLCCALIGTFEQYEVYFSLAILAVIVLNWNKDEFYLYIGIFILFQEQFYLRAGTTTVYRVYSYLLLLHIFKDFFILRVKPQYMPVMCVFAAFCVLCTGRLNFRVSMMVLCDLIFVFVVGCMLHEKPALMRKFIVVFVMAAICAGIYSLTADTYVSYETGLGTMVTITRYVGTVNDANYAGCFYNIALFMAMCSDSFRKWYLRLPIVALLAYFILLTASQTALLCMLIGFCVYVILRYRMAGIPLALIIFSGAAIFVAALIYIPALRDAPALSTISNRIQASLVEMQSGDVATLTTNRSELWRLAWEYFTELPLHKKLLGGSAMTMLISLPELYETIGAVHQSFIQGLLDFGILGTLVVFGTFLAQAGVHALKCLRLDSRELPIDLLRCSVMSAYVFLLYSFTMDLFMDWRVLFFFFF